MPLTGLLQSIAKFLFIAGRGGAEMNPLAWLIRW